MPKKVSALVLLIFIISIDIVYGRDANKTKALKKKNTNIKGKNMERIKRSLNENEAGAVWLNKGMKIVPDSLEYNDLLKDKISNNLNTFRNLEVEPFWATRGRRDSSSAEVYTDAEYSGAPNFKVSNVICKGCPTPSLLSYRNDKVARDEYSPFWGNRGRRSSDENEGPGAVFWGSRGRREDDEPFWGNRGRRKDDQAYWSHTEDEPFWGNRGRRQSLASGNHINTDEEEPFWGNRGRRDDNEPFWGNRGRREDSEPFWGNRGRREDSEPFWGNRGRRKDGEPFWGNRGRRKEELKESILAAIDNVGSEVKSLARLRRNDDAAHSFWANRGRESILKFVQNAPLKSKMFLAPNSETVHDSRIFAEQPKYILVERNSRSSAEEDPYYISRGKKYYLNYSLIKAARDRRGAIEEIVKSVRNDPYYIARGKKRQEESRVNNGTKQEELQKVKDLVCSAIDLITINSQHGKVKREINDNDRDRRTILKKLAAQLQIDPYFVSRGKKSGETADKDYLYNFITDVAEKCDY